MKQKSSALNNVILSSITLLTEFSFLIISPRMYETYPRAFWTYIIGHFVLAVIFNADEYLMNTLLHIEDIDDFESEQAEFDFLKIILSIIIVLFFIGGLVYVFIKSPKVVLFHIIADACEQAVLVIRKFISNPKSQKH